MQQSDQHGPHVDEALKDGRRTAPVGYRAAAAPTDDERSPDESTGQLDPPAPGGALPADEVAARSELASFLEPAAFPADREGLLATAEQHQAPEAVMAELRALEGGRRFETVQEVWEALGGGSEHRD